MSAPGTADRRSVAWRLAAIGLAGAAVTGALYAAGRLHTPNYTFSLFGNTGLAAITLKSLLASQRPGGGALAGRVLLLRRVHRQGDARAVPAAARLGAARRRWRTRHLVAVLWYTSALWYCNG